MSNPQALLGLRSSQGCGGVPHLSWGAEERGSQGEVR
jgi:hypothetical protein